MKKYSQEWKLKTKKWVQKNTDKTFQIHYIENDTEYAIGGFFTAKSAKEEMKKLFS